MISVVLIVRTERIAVVTDNEGVLMQAQVSYDDQGTLGFFCWREDSTSDDSFSPTDKQSLNIIKPTHYSHIGVRYMHTKKCNAGSTPVLLRRHLIAFNGK